MNLLFYQIILSTFGSVLTADITAHDEVNMIVDVINSYHKPTSIALSVCWKRAIKRNFIFKLSTTIRTVQVIESIYDVKETAMKNNLLVVTDFSCDKSKQLLKEGNKLKKFSSHYRWVIMTNSLHRTDTVLELQNYNILIDSEVIVAEQKNNGFIIVMPYKVHINTKELIWEKFGSWHPKDGLKKYDEQNQPTSIRRKNLGSIAIVTSFVITNNSTKMELNSSKNSHIDTISKTGYRQIKHLYYFMNATYVHMFSDTWGYLINGSWTGMIGNIVQGEAELTGTISFITKQRLQVLDFLSYPSPPTARFVFREPSLSYQNNLFLLPFKSNVWYCISALVVILAVILFVNAKWEKQKEGNGMPDETVLKPNVSDVAIMIIGAISQQGSSTELKGTLGRIVMFLLFIAFVFLYTSYSANIIVLLQSTSNQIRSLSDLYNSKLELGSEDTPYNRHLFSTAAEPVRMAIYQNKIAPRGSKPNFMSLDEGVKKLQREPFAFNMNIGTGYKAIEKYFYEHEKCGLQEIEYIQENNPWLACRKHSPYKEIYKIGLLRTQEHGLNDRENRLVYSKKPVCSVHGGSFMSVNMTDFYPALLMLLYGMILAGALLILELLYRRHAMISNSSI